jgi:hydrogenase maturation factor HypF (carbamoyltransferase family)
MALLTEPFDKAKVHWWKLAELPLCPKCNLVCRVYSSYTTPRGFRVQYRKCPRCGLALKTQTKLK